MLYFPFKRVKRTNVQNTVNDALLKLDSYDNLRLEDIKNLPGIKELGLSDDGLRSAIKRARKNVEGIPNFKLLKSKGDEAISFQTKYNPALDKRLDYVKDLNELYYKKEGRNIKDGPIKVIKAHILGQGKIVKKDLLDPKDIQILENKLSYIPDDLLTEGFKNPKFFLTYVGNKEHRKIENRLVNDLVKKYKLLGYNPNTKNVKKFDYVGEKGTKTLKLSDDDKIKLKPANATALEVETTGIDVTGEITASGNISASLNSKIFASSASFGGASFLRAFNVKGAGLDGRLNLQGTAGTDNPGIEFTVNDNTSRALIRLDQVGTNGTALEFFTEPDGGDIANTLTIGHTGHITASGNINTTGNINVTGSVSASYFIGAPSQIVTHAWFSNQTSKFPAGDLSHLMNGNSNFGWADRAWNDSVTKTEVFDNDQLNGVNDHNKGVPIQHNVTDIQLTGYMRASDASDVTQMNYWIFKGNQANGSGPTITFLASASAATVGTNYNEVYITGSTGLQADAGDLIFVFANTDVGGTGTDRNIRGMYTVTAKIRE